MAACRDDGVGRRDYNPRRGKRLCHVPGGQNDNRTKICPSKGARWFRTEAEARAAKEADITGD
ncbi:MAG: hypothetical protein O7C66_01355 [Alphaproteobacteria bacterium]|nr:hypothetical protein [Alphaproteobacteria bacterium]